MKNKLLLIALFVPLLLTGCSTGDGGSTTSSSSSSSSESSSSDTSTSESSTSSESSSGSSSSSSSSSVIHVTSVSLNKTSLTIDTSDGPTSLVATVLPATATNKNLTWSSSNTSVASVNNGTITPLSEGTTTITVSTVDGSKTDSCQVTVTDISDSLYSYVLYGKFNGDSEYTQKNLTPNPYNTSEYMITELTLQAGDEFIIHMIGAIIYKYKDVKTSTSSSLVEAGTNQYIKIKVSGIYSIYSSFTYESSGHVHIAKTGDIDPTPGTVPVSSISLNHTGQYITIGNYFYLTPTILPSNATNKNVTWTSDKLGVATVLSSGKVTGVGKGKCTITATTQDGNKVATCVVLVSDTSVPPYYLFGTIGGQSYIYGDYDYPGILDVTDYYIFYDVPLYEGDRLSVYDYTGHYLTDYYTDDPYVYEYHGEHKIVNIRLYILSYNHNYLTIIE